MPLRGRIGPSQGDESLTEKANPMKLHHVVPFGFSLFALAGCSILGSANVVSDSKTSCEQMTGSIPNGLIGLPTGEVTIVSAQFMAASPLAMGPPQSPTPYARIQPALPEHCQVKGTIASLDPSAPAINFQVNLPSVWNGRSLQYGGGGFNGVLINALGLPPAAPLDKRLR
jgi:Tannase and feruloyl esterase